MRFTFKEVKNKLTGTVYRSFQLNILDDWGLITTAGYLSLETPEYEALKATLMDGATRWQKQEVTFEFEEMSSVPAFTEGKE